MKKKSADSVLSENLRREMEKRHLSETDLVHRSGLSVNTVRALVGEGDDERESVSLAKAQRVAGALGVSIVHLLREDEDPATAMTQRAATRARSEDLPKQLGQLIEEFFVLPDADRRALLAIATEMTSKYRHQLVR